MRKILQQQMSYNDNQQNIEHLLKWLSRQRIAMGEHIKFYSLEQVQESKILPLLLCKLHPTFFTDVNDGGYSHNKYILLLQKYLLQIQDLRLKRTYRHQLLRKECVSDVIRLLLFAIIKHDMKQEFIARIIQMEEEIQIKLMNQLKKINQNVENTMEIKEVIVKIQELEEENQILNQRLNNLQKKNETVILARNQAREENERLIENNRQNIRQKAQIMQKLNIHQIKDYLSMYRDMQNERETLIQLQKDIEADNYRLNEENQQMQEKITEDQQIVQHLNGEILKYKTLLQELKRQGRQSLYMKSSRSNKENANNEFRSAALSHHKMIKSIEQDTTICSFKNITMIEDEQSLQTVMKDYQNDMSDNLQKVYAQINVCNQEIVNLKDQNKNLRLKNHKKQKKITLAAREFAQFCLNYQFTISG